MEALNKEPLEGILEAKEVRNVAIVRDSDGKEYICEVVATEKDKRNSFDGYPIITDLEKQKLLRNGIRRLEKEGIKFDRYYGYEKEGERGGKDPLYYRNYIIDFYKILKKL
ncbi:hypothetical protein KY345_03100 [Candidatus Woesearchaeota archaeon]|nr:hypothetical protein [Candidatus Woesearchaeota archaeon]